MNGKTMFSAIAALGIALASSGCDILDGDKRDNYCQFTVKSDSTTETYRWDSSIEGSGFDRYEDSPFSASFGDSEWDGETFFSYLSLGVRYPTPGTYVAEDMLGSGSVKYYDENGTSYVKWPNDSTTNSQVTITKWDDESVEGSFYAVLRNDFGVAVTLSGTFTSFDSSDSRGLGIVPPFDKEAM